MKKILISCWLEGGLQLLIPRQRGQGFLKVPCGHHHEPWLDEISYDVDGLDGHLTVHCGCYSWETEKIKQIIAEIMPVITNRFPFQWEFVDAIEFKRSLR